MALLPHHRWLEVEQAGAVVVVRFTQPKLVNEDHIRDFTEQLIDLVEKEDCRKLVLNFRQVVSLVSTLLARLVVLQKKMKAAGGQMVLSDLDSRIHESLATLKLTRIFTIQDTEAAALQSLK